MPLPFDSYLLKMLLNPISKTQFLALGLFLKSKYYFDFKMIWGYLPETRDFQITEETLNFKMIKPWRWIDFSISRPMHNDQIFKSEDDLLYDHPVKLGIKELTEKSYKRSPKEILKTPSSKTCIFIGRKVPHVLNYFDKKFKPANLLEQNFQECLSKLLS
jgi:hypothetical protein